MPKNYNARFYKNSKWYFVMQAYTKHKNLSVCQNLALDIGILRVLKFVICIFISLASNNANSDSNVRKINELKYMFDQNDGLNLYFDDYTKLKIGTDIECGAVRDGALYASFGLEGQIMHCSKVVFSLDGSAAVDDSHEWLFKIGLAPLYNSIESQSAEKIVYAKDTNLNDINGANFYNDWYKNLGSRVYYLGNVPLIEMYIGYKFGDSLFKFGRMKGPVGIEDEEVFWNDDGKFAPMGHWLTKDLLSGISYNTRYSILEGEVGVYSGSNPNKGYSNYLNRIESPNLKSNNTPTPAVKLKIHYGDLLPEDFSGYIYGAYMSGTTGSTWVEALEDGKRNSNTSAYGFVVDKYLENNFLNKIHVFAQYSRYDSGLKAKSSQSDKSKKFLDISQSGFFVGSEVTMMDEKLSIGAAYEIFDRFDFNLHKQFDYSAHNPYKNSKQFSKICSIKYKITPAISLLAAYHHLKNPALFASDILDSRKTDKIKITINVNL